MSLKKILIVDFGSQFTQLIARRVRENGVYSEIISHKKKINFQNEDIIGIILSGGPLNVYETKKVSFDKKILYQQIPILGICFGHQIISKELGGKVKQSKFREFGLVKIKKNKNSILTKNFFNKNGTNSVWMSHSDQVTKLPKNFEKVASSANSKFCIIQNKFKKFYGIQFHPEVTHTYNGKKFGLEYGGNGNLWGIDWALEDPTCTMNCDYLPQISIKDGVVVEVNSTDHVILARRMDLRPEPDGTTAACTNKGLDVSTSASTPSTPAIETIIDFGKNDENSLSLISTEVCVVDNVLTGAAGCPTE